MLTPQEEANLILSQWQREAEERSRAKAAALQLGECFEAMEAFSKGGDQDMFVGCPT